MHSKTGSILKRWHSWRVSPSKCAKKWAGHYWQDIDGMRVVACRHCPSFDAKKQLCSINFGSHLRKCVVSSIEAHLHDCKGQSVLEIGFGRFKLAKKLVQRSGGTWTGVEPQRPKDEIPIIGKGGYGHATHIPFPEQSFDKVFGVQSMEHWAQKAGGVREPSSYLDCLAEISRVLKPGGTLYLDAPIHLHGNEMFIMGDLEKIRSLFLKDLWKNVQFEKWREDYQPLEKYPPPETVLINDWPIEIESYSAEQVEQAKNNGVVWMIAITAEKI